MPNISVTEGTAPVVDIQRCDHPTSPRSVCSIFSTTWPSDREGGERLGELHLCKLMAGAVPSITNIYSLVSTLSFFCLTPSQNYPLRRKACLLKSMQHLHEREILATAEKSPVKYQYGQKKFVTLSLFN